VPHARTFLEQLTTMRKSEVWHIGNSLVAAVLTSLGNRRGKYAKKYWRLARSVLVGSGAGHYTLKVLQGFGCCGERQLRPSCYAGLIEGQ
jgi:hypothetical protein